MNGRREIKEATNLSEGTLILWPTTAHLAWTVFNGLGYLRVRRNISKETLEGSSRDICQGEANARFGGWTLTKR